MNMGKEVFMVYFKVLSWLSLEGLWKTTRNLSQHSGSQDGILNG
jgi:hypothetical protein